MEVRCCYLHLSIHEPKFITTCAAVTLEPWKDNFGFVVVRAKKCITSLNLSLDASNYKGWAKLSLKRWVQIGYDNRVVPD